MKRFLEIRDSLMQKLDHAVSGENVLLTGEEALAAQSMIRKYEFCKEALHNAQDAWEDTDKRPDQRNRDAINALGFSKGKAAKEERKDFLYQYYSLVKVQGFSKKNAMELLVKEYDLPSYGAGVKMLQRGIQEARGWLKEKGYKDSFLNRLEPPNWPEQT
jgi:hypothetical protein